MAVVLRSCAWRTPALARHGFAARSTIVSTHRHASTLASVVYERSKVAGSTVGLIAPMQDVSWTYGELSERASQVASAMTNMGYAKGDTVVTDLPNSVENLVLQVACSHLGVAVATVKDAKALAALSDAASVKGAVTHTAEGSTELLAQAEFPYTTVVVEELDGTFGGLGSRFASQSIAPVEVDGSAAMSYWSSTKPLTYDEAIGQMAADAKQKFNMTAADRVLVSITLCHAFGIGSAVGSAFLAGAAVVLPGSSGIRGCGSPTQRAQVTLGVLGSARCSILFADIHTIKALRGADVSALGSAGLPALRGGVCKVGSGATFLDDVKEAKIGPNGELRPLEYAGVPFIALGKK